MENKKAIFLDRDGVINKDKGYVYKTNDFHFEENSLNGLKLIDFNEYLVFIVSNQAGIAKGYYSEEDFRKMSLWLNRFLDKKGVKITKTYYCPHSPGAKITQYKKKCDCRKPGIKLFLKAQKEFNINLKKSYLIGDKTSDILAGKKAGCKTILVETGYSGKDNLFSVKPDFRAKDLPEAIAIINKKLSG